jgi:hypothetical protein
VRMHRLEPKRTVHVVFNINYAAPLITILPAATEPIDKVGPRGIELGLHDLQRAHFGMILNAGVRVETSAASRLRSAPDP